ncbi:MAG: SDR family oxidoreductase [bacterium]|nr:SDR family oxidoreductase [bacterium]
MKKVMIFGSAGMAGHMVTRYLQSLKKYILTDIGYGFKLNPDTVLMDIKDRALVEKIIREKKPEVIINCIGLLVKDSEEQPDEAVYVNSYFPHFLERTGKVNNIKIIHLSTDCVFSGKKGSYRETDTRDGEGFYARSKALGEIINKKDLTFRTSIIGPELKENGTGLFHWFMTREGEVNGYTDVYWTGVTTLELAKAMDAAMDQDLTGLYHLTPEKKISKYELLRLIKERWGKKGITIHKDTGSRSDKSLVNCRKDFHYRVKDYEGMVGDLYEWMRPQKDLYGRYFR